MKLHLNFKIAEGFFDLFNSLIFYLYCKLPITYEEYVKVSFYYINIRSIELKQTQIDGLNVKYFDQKTLYRAMGRLDN